MNISDAAMAFFDACETGKGWDGCAQYCAPDATFSCQSTALADTHTLEAYAEWMKGLLVPLPDFPAADPRVLSVAALSHEGGLAWSTALAAGTDLLEHGEGAVAALGSGYGQVSGTSAAAARPSPWKRSRYSASSSTRARSRILMAQRRPRRSCDAR